MEEEGLGDPEENEGRGKWSGVTEGGREDVSPPKDDLVDEGRGGDLDTTIVVASHRHR